MEQHAEIIYKNIKQNSEYEKILNKVIDKCFENEELDMLKLYVSITLTDNANIKDLNNKYRQIDRETDVLSFPMFEIDEIEKMKLNKNLNKEYEVLGDIIISIPKVEEQAKEYGHSFERELAYMCTHSFFHLIGYDHIEKEDKTKMRAKEDEILNKLGITRDSLISSKR